MLNFGASKPRVKGGSGPQAPPGSTPDIFPYTCLYYVRTHKPMNTNMHDV